VTNSKLLAFLEITCRGGGVLGSIANCECFRKIIVNATSLLIQWKGRQSKEQELKIDFCIYPLSSRHPTCMQANVLHDRKTNKTEIPL
jgi:hypothetical protein